MNLHTYAEVQKEYYICVWQKQNESNDNKSEQTQQYDLKTETSSKIF